VDPGAVLAEEREAAGPVSVAEGVARGLVAAEQAAVDPDLAVVEEAQAAEEVGLV
jgi:hypothetical protein